MNEYAYKQKACIRNKQPDCKSQAVIPSITVETADGINNLANCFVHVSNINTTFYIDEKHRPLIVWAGDVEVDLPADVQTQEQFNDFVRGFKLRNQFLYVKFDREDDHRKIIQSFYFDRTGRIYWADEFEEIAEDQ